MKRSRQTEKVFRNNLHEDVVVIFMLRPKEREELRMTPAFWLEQLYGQ